MFRLQTFASTFSLLILAASAANAADLTITIKDVRSTDGAVLLAVYDSETHFMTSVMQNSPAG